MFTSRIYRLRRYRRKTAGERISPTRRVPRFNIPRLLLTERLSQNLAPRGIPNPMVQRSVLVRQFLKANRLPLVGLRSQRERVVLRSDQTIDRPLIHQWDVPANVPAVKSVCQARHLRRRLLFKIGIAGIGRRRSPGRGGTYRRNVDSETSCQKVR